MKRITRFMLFSACALCMCFLANVTNAQVSIKVVKQGKVNPLEVKKEQILSGQDQMSLKKADDLSIKIPGNAQKVESTNQTLNPKKTESPNQASTGNETDQKMITYKGQKMTLEELKAIRINAKKGISNNPQ